MEIKDKILRIYKVEMFFVYILNKIESNEISKNKGEFLFVFFLP